MSRIATLFNSILLSGILVGAAVLLSCALVPCVPCPATEAGQLAAQSASHEQLPAATADGAGEPAAVTSCRPAPPPTGALLRRGHSADRCAASRHAESGAPLVHGSGTAAGALPTRLAHCRGRFPAATPGPVYVLLCTWLV
jgi:hypothetical protein